MQLNKCTKTTKCDFQGCENTAQYFVNTKGVLKRELAMCSECMQKIYTQIAKLQVPKATQSPFQLKPRLRKEYYEKDN